MYDHFVHSYTLKFVQSLFLVLCVWDDIRINCKYFPTPVFKFGYLEWIRRNFFFCEIRIESNGLEDSKG